LPAPFAARCRQHLSGKKDPHGDMAQCVSQESPELSIREENDVETTNRHLMWHGMFLFLLGLATGLLEQRFANVRMGLAAHLEGVMNGMLLVALGAIWTEVKLPPRAKATAYWTALYGTYANWLVTTLAAVFGTAALSPISAAGHSGKPWQEDSCDRWIPKRQRCDRRLRVACPLGSSARSIAAEARCFTHSRRAERMK
jgi:hydroxylaminobenzene mutase